MATYAERASARLSLRGPKYAETASSALPSGSYGEAASEILDGDGTYGERASEALTDREPYAPTASAALTGLLLDIDFTTDDGDVAVDRNTVGNVDDLSGSWAEIAADTLRRSNKGALIETAATNGVRNNSGTNGAAGSPGTLPTNWTVNLRGTTRQVTAKSTSLGIDYVGIRTSGTTSSATAISVNYDTSTGIAASAGQVRTFSVFLALAAGSLANITSITLGVTEYNSGGSALYFTPGPDIKAALTAGLQRFDLTYTTGVGTASVQPAIVILQSGSGVAVDLTLWHGWPQSETGAGASSPIRTTTAAVTRAADQVLMTLPAGTSAVEYTFDDGSRLLAAAPAGPYTIPTDLPRPHIARMQALA